MVSEGMTAFAYLAALVVVWGWLFFILTGEWEVNEQYSHGWFIPILSGWIFWQRWISRPEPHPAESASRVVCYAVIGLLVVPTALGVLIASVYPDWRLVLWILGVSAFASSVSLTVLVGGWAWGKHLLFAFVFALLAIPWPTALERWLTQELSLLAATMTTWILPLLGVAAVCHGTMIDVGNGTLGVDDACSGIRSFQSSIMAALFLGELFRLRWSYRTSLVVVGLFVAYALNVLRMILLSVAVAYGGSDALEKFHDPAGFAILFVTIGVIWLLCWILQKFPGTIVVPFPLKEKGSMAKMGRAPALTCFAVMGVMLLMIGGSEGWFAWKARGIVRAPAWTVLPAQAGEVLQDKPLLERVQEMLHYDRGFQRSWTDEQGRLWHLIFTEWEPKRMSLYYAQPHLPEQCQRMIGREIISKSEMRKTEVNGIPIVYNLYRVRAENHEFYLMYIVNDDRIDGREITAELATPANRLKAVLAGRRNMGQRSLQLALIGESEQARAEKAMLEVLPSIVSPSAKTH